MALKILIVEKNESTRITLSAYFSLNEFNVDTAPSVELALKRLQSSKYDVVLTSDSFGGNKNTGFIVLEKAKELYPFCNVVIVSESEKPEDVVYAMKSGAFDYIMKPICFTSLDDLIVKLNKGNKDLISLETLEKTHIINVLAYASTYEEAANILGINMATLWRKRKAYALKIRKKIAA